MKWNGLRLIFMVFVAVACSPAGNRDDAEKSENAIARIQQEMILIPGGSFIRENPIKVILNR